MSVQEVMEMFRNDAGNCIKTRREWLCQHDAAGWPSEWLEEHAGDDADRRHAWRVSETLSFAAHACPIDPCCVSVRLLIEADINGVGGHGGMGLAGGAGRRSERALWGCVLGKGRWNATDGPAYEAAARDAVDALEDFGGSESESDAAMCQIMAVAAYTNRFTHWAKTYYSNVMEHLFAYTLGRCITADDPDDATVWAQAHRAVKALGRTVEADGLYGHAAHMRDELDEDTEQALAKWPEAMPLGVSSDLCYRMDNVLAADKRACQAQAEACSCAGTMHR